MQFFAPLKDNEFAQGDILFQYCLNEKKKETGKT
jgi:hypothetical protein